MQKPDYLLTVITAHPQPCDLQPYLDKLSQTFHNAQILISGRQLFNEDLETGKNIRLLSKLDDLIEFVDEQN